MYLATRFLYFVFTVHIFKSYSRLTNFFINKFLIQLQSLLEHTFCYWKQQKVNNNVWMVKLNSHKSVKYLWNQSNKCSSKDASFLFKTSWLHDINRLSMIFKWNSELLEARTLKSSKETGWSQISIFSFNGCWFFFFFFSFGPFFR